MATHSSILAWRIPWTQEPGGLQSMGSQRVKHNISGKMLARGATIEPHPPWDGGDGAVCLTLRKARRQTFLALLNSEDELWLL